MPIFKTTMTVTVFGEFDNATDASNCFSNWDLPFIASQMKDGELVGSARVDKITRVPRKKLAAEMESIGSSSDFFDHS